MHRWRFLAPHAGTRRQLRAQRRSATQQLSGCQGHRTVSAGKIAGTRGHSSAQFSTQALYNSAQCSQGSSSVSGLLIGVHWRKLAVVLFWTPQRERAKKETHYSFISAGQAYLPSYFLAASLIICSASASESDHSHCKCPPTWSTGSTSSAAAFDPAPFLFFAGMAFGLSNLHLPDFFRVS